MVHEVVTYNSIEQINNVSGICALKGKVNLYRYI